MFCAKYASNRRKCPTFRRAFCLYFVCFHIHSGFARCFLTSFLWGMPGVQHPPSIAWARGEAFTCGSFVFCLSGFWSRDMQNPFPGTAGEGQGLAAHRLHHEASTSPGMLSSKFCATSCWQEKILQIPPPVSCRRESPFSE